MQVQQILFGNLVEKIEIWKRRASFSLTKTTLNTDKETASMQKMLFTRLFFKQTMFSCKTFHFMSNTINTTTIFDVKEIGSLS